MHSVNVVLEALERGGLLIRSHDDPPAYLPVRDLADVSIGELMTAIRAAGEDRFLNPEMLALSPVAEELVKRVELAVISSLGDVSVKTLATEDSPAAGSIEALHSAGTNRIC
jgi:membrane protein